MCQCVSFKNITWIASSCIWWAMLEKTKTKKKLSHLSNIFLKSAVSQGCLYKVFQSLLHLDICQQLLWLKLLALKHNCNSTSICVSKPSAFNLLFTLGLIAVIFLQHHKNPGNPKTLCIKSVMHNNNFSGELEGGFHCDSIFEDCHLSEPCNT